MKKFISKLSLMKIISALLVVILLVVFVSGLPQLAMKTNDIPELSKVGLSVAGEEIAKDAGEILVAENGGKKLYVDTKTVSIKVVDTKTGMMWTSSPADGDLTEEEKAPLYISFLDATGALSEWDAYTYCIAADNTTRELEEGESRNNTYAINRLVDENKNPIGFRATLNITELESSVLNEYMPQQISTERYQECFLDKIDALLAAGKIDAEAAERYNKALNMIYAIDDKNEEYYYNKYAGTPPVTVTTILIDLAKKVNYTTEDLINDSRQYNKIVEISHSADFTVYMDVTLDNGDLVVNIPTYEIKDNNLEAAESATGDESAASTEYYTLQKITVFPNFGLVDATKFENGFIFVPDGSGALFDINAYNGKYEAYSRPLYRNDYYDKLYNETEYKEDLMMPVFGMGKEGAEMYEAPSEESTGAAEAEAPAEEPAAEVKPAEEAPAEEAPEPANEAEAPSEGETGVEETPVIVEEPKVNYNGFMAIIESGAETASITVQLGTPDTSNGGTHFNKVYPSFDVIQYSNVKVFGPYSSSDAKFLAKTKQFDVDIKVRYKLYTEDCSYYTMAQDYKNYIIEKNNLQPEYAQSPELFLDVISSLTVEDKIMGIPYDRTVSMTTYSELKTMLDKLGTTMNKVVSYKGAYNGGIYNSVNLDAKRTSANGSKKDYDTLMNTYGASVYMSTPVSRVYKDTAVFNPSKHALAGYDSKAIEIFDYDIPSGRLNTHDEGYWIVGPKYLNNVISSFSKKVGTVNLAIEDLGNEVYANYKKNGEVSLYEGEMLMQEALKTLGTDRNIILYNPIASRMLYADYCADISRESSDYGLIAHNVPFRQLVMNGLTKYTTLNVNESSSGQDYYINQALELGSCPKFIVTAKDVARLKESNYNKLYSTEFDVVQPEITAVSTAVSEAFKKIGTTEIIDHKIVGDKVFKTTYASGIQVVVNYNTYDVETPYGKIGAMGYVMLEGGEVNE